MIRRRGVGSALECRAQMIGGQQLLASRFGSRGARIIRCVLHYRFSLELFNAALIVVDLAFASRFLPLRSRQAVLNLTCLPMAVFHGFRMLRAGRILGTEGISAGHGEEWVGGCGNETE